MRCVDSRRLTGPNLIWDNCGAVLDVAFEGVDESAAIDAWQTQVRRMLETLGWENEQTCVRRFKDGASLAISAPIDALYAATDINDWAFDAASDVVAGRSPPDLAEDAERLREYIQDERNPALLSLKRAAAERNVPLLVDTESVSAGYGRYSQTWPLDRLPAPAQVPWHYLSSIPVALITGTNGKTTSVRLASKAAEAAGYTVGLSSTDWIAAGDRILDTGDYSGPGGARSVLRDQSVDLALLETARGGLLRRGLAVDRADCVLITNVASDHLGEFGVHNVDELADVKWVATRALDESSTLVLNADDPRLVERARGSQFNVIWFSPDPEQSILRAHVGDGGTVCTVASGNLRILSGGETTDLLPIKEIPITLGGAAEHNVYNALGVTGLGLGLGLPADAIAAGLRNMSPNDNPGRSNLYNINGASFIVDFAHNPHGMEAFMATTRALDATRRKLLIGQAGDRSDQDIKGLASTACVVDWDEIVIKRMDGYARGRKAGEVAALLHDEFVAQGVRPGAIRHEDDELSAVERLVDTVEPGELVILLIHENRPKVLEYLNSRAGTEGV